MGLNFSSLWFNASGWSEFPVTKGHLHNKEEKEIMVNMFYLVRRAVRFLPWPERA